jgi:predicted acetyltransferase
MTRMMQHQLEDVHQRGEPLAALFASESAIYGRFGYGVGSFREQWTIERQHTAYARPYQSPGRFFFVDPADLTKELPRVSRRSAAARPGVIEKPLDLWERESQAREHQEGGRGGLFYVAYEDGGKVEGYAKYRTNGTTLTVNELMATTTEAHAALWRFCFDVDLVATTEAERRPVDDPLPWMLADPRRLQRVTRDGMWLRVVDVAAALEQRRYMVDDRLVLEVRDDLCPWNDGRFDLEGSPEGATCRATTASPDLAIAVSGLASTYLGAAGFSTLAPAGLLDEHTPGALLRADRMFSVQYRPWTPHNF